MKNKHELGAIIILNIAKNNRPEVNALLLRNGVSLPNEASDLQVAQVLTELLKKSKTFKNEFLKLVENSQVLNEFSNVDGKIDFSQYNVPNTFNGTVKPLYANALTSNSSLTSSSVLNSTKTPEETKSSGTGFTLDKGLGIFSQALNGFLQYNQNVTDQKLAEASIAQAQSGGLSEYGNINLDDGQGMGTGTIVFLTILGLSAVGGAVWYYVKNKK
jgi:hypothetical protein